MLSFPDCIRHGFHILVKLGFVVLHCTIREPSDMSVHAAVVTYYHDGGLVESFPDLSYDHNYSR